jgi:hypothetical protein
VKGFDVVVPAKKFPTFIVLYSSALDVLSTFLSENHYVQVLPLYPLFLALFFILTNAAFQRGLSARSSVESILTS